MTPGGNFFELWDLPRLHPGSLPGLLGWKMRAFGLCLLYSGSTELLCFRFSDSFSGFRPKSVSEHSQKEFYQSYWVENCTARLFSRTSWKNDLLKLMNTSSNKLEIFNQFFEIFKIFENYSSGSYKIWKRRIGLKTNHAVPRIARCTAISTNGVSDYWIIFRHSRGFPYRRLSTDTIFQCAIKDSSPQRWSSRAHFFSNGAPNDSDNNGSEQCGPNVPMRCADNSQKWSHSLQYTGYHNCEHKMLCPSKASQSILTTNSTYSKEFTTRSSDEGVFHRFPTRMAGFYPTFTIFVSVKP